MNFAETTEALLYAPWPSAAAYVGGAPFDAPARFVLCLYVAAIERWRQKTIWS